MGTSYSACAFFGTFAPRHSEIGEILSKFIEEGTPGETSSPDVEIDSVGNAPMGEEWIVVRVTGDHFASRDEPIVAPVLLAEDKPGKSVLILAAFLRGEGIDPNGLPPIGWHFAARAS